MINRRDFLAGCCLCSVACPPRIGCHAVTASASSQLARDPRRPQFHLLPPANWMNDPNGPIYWKGEYHMFYQYNPNGAFWGDMHWGHAISPDMVHWRHLPVALAPSPGGPDASGCFTGSAVANGNQVAVLYTGVVSVPESKALKETQCLATGTGKTLTTWTKDPRPVIAAPPAGTNVSGFRDPSPWQHGEWWYMVVGSGSRGRGGAALLYRSKDLHHWEYLHAVARGAVNGSNESNPVDSGDMWECPDLFPLGDKHVLIYSTQGKVHWESGDLDPKEWIFHSERRGVLDYGSFYAAKTQLDRVQNRIVWGWVPETRPLEEYRASGWAGMMSLPRVLTLDEDRRLNVQVAHAVEVLRQRPQVLKASANEQQNQQQFASMYIEQCCGEILCTVKRSAEPFCLSLTNDNPAESWLTLRYDPSQSDKFSIDDKLLPLRAVNGDEIEIHLYIDGSVIEAFVSRQIAFTKRFYYAGTSAPRVGLRVIGKTANISSFSLWQISPISADRLTA